MIRTTEKMNKILKYYQKNLWIDKRGMVVPSKCFLLLLLQLLLLLLLLKPLLFLLLNL